MPVFRADPCGIICILITYSALIYADYVAVIHLIRPTFAETLWSVVHTLAFNLLIFMITLAHIRAVCSDPGLVPLPADPINFKRQGNKDSMPERPEGWSVCLKCSMYRPPRAHHCRICERCVRRMDHHCPWINNCVGEFNQKYFIQFLVYVGFLSIYSLALVLASWLSDPTAKRHGSKHVKIMHSVILVVESVLFGLFVLAIFCDQIQAILSDETAVEHVKRNSHIARKVPKCTLLKEVFGQESVLYWFLPCVGPGSSNYYYNVAAADVERQQLATSTTSRSIVSSNNRVMIA